MQLGFLAAHAAGAEPVRTLVDVIRVLVGEHRRLTPQHTRYLLRPILRTQPWRKDQVAIATAKAAVADLAQHRYLLLVPIIEHRRNDRLVDEVVAEGEAVDVAETEGVGGDKAQCLALRRC